MDDANHSSPQADFRLISQSFRTAAGEIEKIQNLPAITGGDRILAEIRQMRQEAKEQTTRLEERITAITTRLEERITTSHQSLLTLMSTNNLNSAARVQNTYLSTPSDPVSPFLNPLTGAVIFGFPTTSAEIGRMEEHDVDTILQQLGLQTTVPTTLAGKKRQLRMHIGLRSQIERSA